jgi:hypothetical protein
MATRALVVACCAVLIGGSAHSAELRGRLTTLAYTQERFDVDGNTEQIPLFQFVSLNAYDLGNEALSFHLDGFGKVDLRDQTYDHNLDGELTYAYLQWRDRERNLFVRAGRQFVRAGVASEYLDGVYGDWLSQYRIGFQAYAGRQVNDDIGGRSGDLEWGGRLYTRQPRFEVGASAMETRDDDQTGFARLGLDGWAQVIDKVAVNAHGFWDRISEEWFDYQFLLTWEATAKLLFSADYGQVIPNLFLSHTSIFGNLIFSDDKQRELGLRADYRVDRHWTLSADARRYDYSDGDDDWTEGAEGHYRWGKGLRNEVGAAFENWPESKRTHLYGRYTFDNPWVTSRSDLTRLFYGLDFILYHFDDPIFPGDRQHYTYSTTATLGADIGDHWQLTGSLDYGTRPDYRDYTTVTAGGSEIRVPSTRESDLGFRQDVDATVKLVYNF